LDHVNISADKHKRIFAAATVLFDEHGFEAVTTQQISDRADVAAGTLFRYASTRGELLLMVYNAQFRARSRPEKPTPSAWPTRGAVGRQRTRSVARADRPNRRRIPSIERSHTTKRRRQMSKNISNVTVLGTGVLGSQIAFQTAYHGFDVVTYDIGDSPSSA
jgi:AcrR family transcriptional regulator